MPYHKVSTQATLDSYYNIISMAHFISAGKDHFGDDEMLSADLYSSKKVIPRISS